MIKRNDVYSLVRSFRCAFHGIAYCIINERNMRIHLSAVVLVSFFSYYYGLERLELALLLLCCGLVISAEAINTAIEALVNLGSPAYHPYARIAKDVAAGGVAVTAIAAAIVGLILFLDPQRLSAAAERILFSPLRTGAVAALLFAAVLFIFTPPRRKSRP